MAITTHNPNLQLVGGQLGSKERLEAGAHNLIANRRGNGELRIALFSGARPSPEERESGFYTLYGTSPVDQCIGLWSIPKTHFTEFAALPEQLRAGGALNDTASAPNQPMPVDINAMLSTDGYDLTHLIFDKFRQYERADGTSTTLPDAIQQQGSKGHGATWGLVSLQGSGGQRFPEDVFYNGSSTSSINFERPDGKSATFTTRKVDPLYSQYITVGDIIDEPTANLVLHSGAESGLASQPSQIRPHRLRIRMNPLTPVTLGV